MRNFCAAVFTGVSSENDLLMFCRLFLQESKKLQGRVDVHNRNFVFSIKVFWVRKFIVLQSDVITRGLAVEALL